MIILILFFTLMKVDAQNRWEKLSGPEGGSITGLKAKGDTLIASMNNRGVIFYSINGGDKWTQTKLKFNDVVPDFVFTDDGGVICSTLGSGVYKSFDLQNWKKINALNLNFRCLGKDSEGKIYAACDEGYIYSSSDNGENLTYRELKTGDRMEKFVLTSDSNFFAGGMNKIFRKSKTIDNYWVTIDFPDSIGDNYPIFLASDSLNNLYALAGNRVLLSTDQGNTWKYKSLFWGENTYDFIYNNRLIAAFGDQTHFFGHHWGIAVSDDQGKTWRWPQKGLPPRFSTALKLAKSGNNTYLGTNAAGVLKAPTSGTVGFL